MTSACQKKTVYNRVSYIYILMFKIYRKKVPTFIVSRTIDVVPVIAIAVLRSGEPEARHVVYKVPASIRSPILRRVQPGYVTCRRDVLPCGERDVCCNVLLVLTTRYAYIGCDLN